MEEEQNLIQDLDNCMSGGLLMNGGFLIPRLWGDFQAKIYLFEEIGKE